MAINFPCSPALAASYLHCLKDLPLVLDRTSAKGRSAGFCLNSTKSGLSHQETPYRKEGMAKTFLWHLQVGRN